jgi:hypothetical protein
MIPMKRNGSDQTSIRSSRARFEAGVWRPARSFVKRGFLLLLVLDVRGGAHAWARTR